LVGGQIAVDAGLRSDAALPRRLRGVTWNAADNATTVWVLRVTFGPRSKTVHVRVESCSVQADSQGMMDSEEYELVEVRAGLVTAETSLCGECRLSTSTLLRLHRFCCSRRHAYQSAQALATATCVPHGSGGALFRRWPPSALLSCSTRRNSMCER
jgi:hypothetical protein